MNILIVTAMFPPIRTGTSFYSKNLASTLQQQGHNITLLTVSNKEIDDSKYIFELTRIKALHINLKNYFKHLRITSIFPSNYIRIKEVAKESDAEVLLIVNHYLDIVFPAIFAAKYLRLPLFISVGTQMQSLNRFRNIVLRFMDRVICGRLIFPFCDKIISWDSEIERYITDIQRKKIAKKSVIIPFGANGNIEELLSIKKDYSLKNTILGVGAIVSQRDYLFQIGVLKELLAFYPNIKMKIIGHIYKDKPIKYAKELGITDNIEFMGELPHQQVIKEMMNADIHWMMLSGEYVGLGTATLEAMLVGTPSISNSPSNLFGEAKLIDMENYIYATKDLKETANKIVHVLNEKDLRKNIGQNGRKFIQKNLNWETVGNKMTDLFQQYI